MFGSLVARLGAGGERILAFGEASHARASFLLAVVALLCFLSGFFAIPPTDRDESRFAQATKQMLETGDFVAIRFQEEARLKKPVGIYWLQAAAVEATGRGADAPISAYRLPSLAGALLSVLLTYWALLPLLGRRGALIAGLMLAGTILLSVEARIAKTDAVLLACTVAAMGALIRAYLDPAAIRPNREPLIFWLAVGIGALVKGPITLMVAALAAVVLCLWRREARWLLTLRPVSGLILALAIVLPWLVAIVLRSGGDFFRDSIGQDMLGKVAQGAEAHWGPPGTYIATIWATAWPATPFLALALPWLWRNRRQEAVLVLLAWLVPSWLVFEAVSTKLPHYVLPLVPALAGLAALAVTEGIEATSRLWRRLALAGLWLLPLLIVLALTGGLAWFEGRISVAGLACGALAVLVGLAAARIGARDLRVALPATLIAAGLTFLGAFQFDVPALGTIWLSKRLAGAVRVAAPCSEPLLASAGYDEPSLVFMTRTDLLLTNGIVAADFLAKGECRLALVDATPVLGDLSHETFFRARLAELGVAAEEVALIEGRNINGFRARHIGLWRLAPKG